MSDTEKMKCLVCKGSGYVGPDQREDTPFMDRMIGCAPCSFCTGGYSNLLVQSDEIHENQCATDYKLANENARLKDVIHCTIKALKNASDEGAIIDTIWHSDAETLFDFLADSVK